MNVSHSRRVRLLATGLVAAAAVAVAGSAEASAPVACEGNVALTGTSNLQIAAAGPHTIVSFDFTGLHDLCLADGTRVVATIAGHLVQRLAPNGDLTLRFDEVLSHGGGELAFRGEASLAGTNWQSHVQSVGRGTGPLAGIQAQGSFYPTGPASFSDVLYYVYR